MRGQSRLGGDRAADGLGGGGDAASTASGHVDLHLTGGADGERRVGRAFVDLPAGGGAVGDLVDHQPVMAADAVDDLLRAGHSDRHVVQCRLGERTRVAGDHREDEGRQADHRQDHGADGGAIARGV